MLNSHIHGFYFRHAFSIFKMSLFVPYSLQGTRFWGTQSQRNWIYQTLVWEHSFKSLDPELVYPIEKIHLLVNSFKNFNNESDSPTVNSRLRFFSGCIERFLLPGRFSAIWLWYVPWCVFPCVYASWKIYWAVLNLRYRIFHQIRKTSLPTLFLGL